jgi:hypothetical protein
MTINSRIYARVTNAMLVLALFFVVSIISLVVKSDEQTDAKEKMSLVFPLTSARHAN